MGAGAERWDDAAASAHARLLADLVAARRPTVTSALSDLTRRGLVRLVDDGWLLSGEPPGELLDVTAMAVRRIS